MRIALVNPPEENLIVSEVPINIKSSSGSLPPMGLLYLEAAVSGIAGIETKIFDFSLDSINHKIAEEEIKRFSPDIMGVTGHTYNLIDMLEVSHRYKRNNADGIVIFGGPHASAFPDKTIQHKNIDIVVSGEGEAALCELLEVIKKNRCDFSNVDGILWKNKNGDICKNKERQPVMNLDGILHPKRDVIDFRKYHYGIGSTAAVTGLVSSRGCPFRCSFCSTPGTRFRCRSAADVAIEMEECKNLGIGDIYFVDDTFNVDRQRVIDICKEIKKRNIKISWNYRGRVDLIDEEQLAAVREAGCRRIHLGVETDTDEGLRILQKGITVDRIKDVFKMVRSSGIESMAYFMIGCPHQVTADDVMRTADFAVSLNPDYALFGIMTPYPGTKLYEMALEKGILNPAVWENFVESPDKSFSPPPWSEYFSLEQLNDFLRKTYRRFYRRPGYVLKEILKVRSPKELFRKALAGLDVIK